MRMTDSGSGGGGAGPSWRMSLPHVCVATLTSFLFGYHSGVVNEPLESISADLGFAGNTLAEGMRAFLQLVVSICLGGAFVGCLFSGSIADGIGQRRAFQLSALPMIIGAAISALTNSLKGMLLGRFLVGTGMRLGPPVASLYITEVSPPTVRGTYGSFVQIATCLGIIVSFLVETRRSPPPLEPAPTPCLDIVARHLDKEKSSTRAGSNIFLPLLLCYLSAVIGSLDFDP
ncbi:probable plastidic glucose transporter 2 [Miscanthus floridulus]|uniref:probable plastidic glucose transporter 2 n=1 Tax=Miscanthus floridulus TaxID=154761 RepID=UPI00345884B9